MEAEWDIYLGEVTSLGLLSPYGRKTTIKKNEVVRQDRAVSGALKTDILYVKNEFILSYSKATESAIDTFDYWYRIYEVNMTPLTLYLYTDVGTFLEYTVIPKPVDRSRLVRAADNLYTGVTLVLTEV